MNTNPVLERIQEAARIAAVHRFASEELDIHVLEELPSDSAVYRTWPEGKYRYVKVRVIKPLRLGGSSHLYVLNKITNEVIASTGIGSE